MHFGTPQRPWSAAHRPAILLAIVICLLPRAPVTAQPEWCLPVLDSHSLDVKTAVYVGDPPWVVTSDFMVWAARVGDNPPPVQEVVARRPTGGDWVWRCRGTV